MINIKRPNAGIWYSVSVPSVLDNPVLLQYFCRCIYIATG